MIEWSGIYHIMATPVTDGGALDQDGLPRLVERALETGWIGSACARPPAPALDASTLEELTEFRAAVAG
jgi:hypothetical protein